MRQSNQTCPSDRKPATSITGVKTSGSNSGLLTPTFASEIPTPTMFVYSIFSLSYCISRGQREKKIAISI